MKKAIGLVLIGLFLSGCAETVALLGPASTSSLTGGNIIQSATTSVVSYGVKKQTGKSPMEHAVAYAEKHNPERKQSKCVTFLEVTESEFCEILKKNISNTKKKILRHKIVKSSKIEDLAKNSIIRKKR